MKCLRVPGALLEQTTAALPPAARDETAVPSYCHANPLIRRLFWRRLDVALALARIRSTDHVLDFGAGSGVLLPTLEAVAARVTATDIELGPARALANALGLRTEMIPAERFATWATGRDRRVDVVLALDVLEHLGDDELASVGVQLHGLVAPGGRLVVSGPTESPAYRLGRWAAGFGHAAYHHRSIYDINALLERYWLAEEVRFVPRVPRAFVVTRYVPRRA